MVCLGLKPGAAGWNAQTNILSYGGTRDILLSLIIWRHFAILANQIYVAKFDCKNILLGLIPTHKCDDDKNMKLSGFLKCYPFQDQLKRDFLVEEEREKEVAAKMTKSKHKNDKIKIKMEKAKQEMRNWNACTNDLVPNQDCF